MNTNTTPQVGKYYRWKGPKASFYMGKCTEVQGARVRFDNGPAMLDDGRYVETEPARAILLPVYDAGRVQA